ncbi:hypothetical protein ACH5RR_000902 [Cinchona calisaya]|uniref:Uncharacterized protein n=1 Tax=Cinchona calisaya TaxID=153742 RepID=A0ABD3B287_9GENT
MPKNFEKAKRTSLVQLWMTAPPLALLGVPCEGSSTFREYVPGGGAIYTRDTTRGTIGLGLPNNGIMILGQPQNMAAYALQFFGRMGLQCGVAWLLCIGLDSHSCSSPKHHRPTSCHARMRHRQSGCLFALMRGIDP